MDCLDEHSSANMSLEEDFLISLSLVQIYFATLRWFS